MSRKLAIDILARDGNVTLTCNGNSMRPIMAPHDKLLIQKVPHDSLEVGDAVFCQVNGGLQVHKISAIDVPNQRFQISNNRGHVNGYVSARSIFGLCVQVNDTRIVKENRLA